MKTLYLCSLVVAMALPASAQSPTQHVDSLMAQFAGTDGPGGVVTVVQDGRVVFMRAYGMASLEQGIPVHTGTRFDLGSVAKQFTGFAIALLAEAGELDLDDDVREYLPQVPDFGHVITLRHLLHHTSGLREIYDAKALAGWRGGESIRQEEALEITAYMRELNFEPGNQYLYCNTGYMLLADVVSAVSGTPFPDWMRENVFVPLGMHGAEIMDEPGEVIRGAADSYAPVEGGYRRMFDYSTAYGQGGIYATAGDMVRWMPNFETLQVGGPAVLQRLVTPGVLNSGDTLSYAMGIGVREYRGLRVYQHTGASAGYRSGVLILPDLNAGVFVQGNRSDFPPGLRYGVAEAFFGSLMEPRPDPPPGPEPEEAVPFEPPAELDEFSGRYFSEELETLYTVSVENGELRIRHWRHGSSAMEPIGEDLFDTALGGIRFERTGGMVTGIRMRTGRIRNLLFERLR